MMPLWWKILPYLILGVVLVAIFGAMLWEQNHMQKERVEFCAANNMSFGIWSGSFFEGMDYVCIDDSKQSFVIIKTSNGLKLVEASP